MPDNRTTELLRKLLDERGVSCHTHYLYTSWCVGPKLYYAVDNLDGTLIVANLTPEQAIAATLGGGTCEWMLKEKWPNRSGDDHVYGYETSCGARHTWWPDSLPNFCPTCGGKVKAVGA